jgi:hypothetical protein
MGATGSQGIGVTGLQGATGVSFGGSGGGETGVQGVTGISGSDGMDGVQGLAGLRGLDGLDGNDGAQGDTGASGVTGPVGSFPGITSISSQESITNTNVETTIATATVSSSSLNVGSQFRFSFQGTHQNANHSGTLTVRMYIGSNASQTIQVASGNTCAQTYMDFIGYSTIRSLGSSGTFIGTGIYSIHTSATAVTKAYQGSASTSSVDTTADTLTIKLTAQWATANDSNSLLIQNATIERVI